MVTCKPGKIFNEKTGRCISLDGKTAKKLYPTKVCESRKKVLNPKTGRCVKKGGIKGKAMSKAVKKIQGLVGLRQALMRDIRNEYNQIGPNSFTRLYGREMSKLSEHQKLALLGNKRFGEMYISKLLK